MKIVFLRHGESMDDVYNEYGGWTERELSPNGVKTAYVLAKKLQNQKRSLNIKEYDLIYTSPLKRASQTAEIISSELNIITKVLPYLKERNTYGLLGGVNKEVAETKYTKLNDLYKKGLFIPAAERYADFVERIKVLMHYLKKSSHENIICVTHGHVITVIIEEVLGKYRESLGNGSMLTLESTKSGWKILKTTNLTILDKKENPSQEKEYRKFKLY